MLNFSNYLDMKMLNILFNSKHDKCLAFYLRHLFLFPYTVLHNHSSANLLSKKSSKSNHKLLKGLDYHITTAMLEILPFIIS